MFVASFYLSASRKFIEIKHVKPLELLTTNPRPQVLNMISWLLRIVSCFKWIVLKIHCICAHLYIKHCKNKDKKSTKLKIHKPMSLPFGVLGGALSMYVYMYICIRVCKYIYIYIYDYICIYIHTFIHIYIWLYMYIHTHFYATWKRNTSGHRYFCLNLHPQDLAPSVSAVAWVAVASLAAKRLARVSILGPCPMKMAVKWASYRLSSMNIHEYPWNMGH